MPEIAKLLTVRETAGLASRLSGFPCSPRRVRHMLVAGALGTDVARRPHGQTRLYGPIDVALVRLALRLSGEGLSPWVTRVVLTYLRNEIVRAWRAGAPVALMVVGVRGSLEPVLKGRPGRAVAWVPLREIWRGVEGELEQVVQGRQTVWMWRDVSVHSIPRVSS